MSRKGSIITSVLSAAPHGSLQTGERSQPRTAKTFGGEVRHQVAAEATLEKGDGCQVGADEVKATTTRRL